MGNEKTFEMILLCANVAYVLFSTFYFSIHKFRYILWKSFSLAFFSLSLSIEWSMRVYFILELSKWNDCKSNFATTNNGTLLKKYIQNEAITHFTRKNKIKIKHAAADKEHEMMKRRREKKKHANEITIKWRKIQTATAYFEH